MPPFSYVQCTRKGAFYNLVLRTDWIGGGGFGLRDDPLMGRLAPSPRAVPALSCGAGLRQEPIHVVDPQGRIVRTLGD